MQYKHCIGHEDFATRNIAKTIPHKCLAYSLMFIANSLAESKRYLVTHCAFHDVAKMFLRQ